MLIAHSLRSQSKPPPVTLLANTRQAAEYLRSSTQTIAYLHTSGHAAEQQTVDFELARSPRQWPGAFKERADSSDPVGSDSLVPERHGPIYNLILSGQSQYATSTLRSLRHRLGKHSTILFITPGLGVIEQVNQQVFPDPTTRPHYLLAHSTHFARIIDTGKYTRLNHQIEIDHPYPGALYITQYPLYGPNLVVPSHTPDSHPPLPPSAQYLFDIILKDRRLSAIEVDPLELHMMQLQTLAIDCVIKPVLSFLDAPHSSLLSNHYATRVARLLIAEISLVIRSLPEIKSDPLVEVKFNPARLEELYIKALWRRYNRTNVTLTDMRRGHQIDLNYFNGYIVQRGNELGLRCYLNYAFWQMAKAKQKMIYNEIFGSTSTKGSLGPLVP